MSDQVVRFWARLVAGGENNAWTLLYVPHEVGAKLGGKGRIGVKGSINGYAFQSSLFPTGDGKHHLMVNKAMQAGARARAGDLVHMELRPTERKKQRRPSGKK